MTQHPLHGVASAVVVVVLLSVGAVSAQTVTTPSMKTDTSEPSVQQGRQNRVHARQQPLIRRAVAPPSSDFTTYIEGELVRVSIPSNWRKLPGSNAVTFAPEGAYGNVGVKSVFTHGLGMGLARNDKRNLRITTGDFIGANVLAAPSPGRTFRYRRVAIAARPGLHTVVSTVSEATGEPERIEIFTTLLRDGTLFYVLAVTPRDAALDYADTFRRVVESIEIMDGDRYVR
jgi:hypothetical protein